MKQLFFLFALLVAVILFAAWSSKPGTLETLFQKSGISQEKIVKIKNTQIKVEVANTREERTVGLTKYQKLEPGSGMLFVFESRDVKPEFWMKDMKFSADIIWIKDGKISELTENVSAPSLGVSESSIPRYSPKEPVDYVLEIAGGEAKRNNLGPEDEVELPPL